MPRRLTFATLTIVSFILFASSSRAQLTDFDQYLHEHYSGKTFLIRNFQSSDHLLYDSSGDLVGKEIPGTGQPMGSLLWMTHILPARD